MGEHITYPDNAGVYKFTCIANNKIYIGKSFNIRKRIYNHRMDIKKNKNHGIFHRAIIKYGWDSFEFEILEVIENFDKSKDGPHLLEREAHYIRLFESTDRNKGYNICEYSTDRTGCKHSDETKKKMSIASLGKKKSEEMKIKLRNRTYSKKTRQKMRESKLGSKASDSTKEKMRRSRLGMVMSEESKSKLSKSRKGIKFSEEHKEKLRQAKLGKTLSEEHKEKLRQAKENSEYKHSEETKRKIGQASRERKTGKRKL